MTRFIAQLRDTNIPKVPLNDLTIQTWIDFMLQLAAALSLVYVIIGAVKFTVSSGESQAVAAARRTVIYSVIGLVIAVAALAISTIIQAAGARASGASNPLLGPDGIIPIVIEKLSFAVAVASVIMVIVGGFRYITSSGVPQTAQAARNTIIYALVGLTVAFAGGAIVTFVLERL